MPITFSQREEFAKKVFEESLSNAIDWIQSNMHPNDVFEADELKSWVNENAKPGEVFDYSDLTAWAEANGFVHVAS